MVLMSALLEIIVNNQQFFDVFVSVLLMDADTAPLLSMVDGIDSMGMRYAVSASELYADAAVATVLADVTPELAYEAVAGALRQSLDTYEWNAADALAGRYACMQGIAESWGLSTAKLNAALRFARRGFGVGVGVGKVVSVV